MKSLKDGYNALVIGASGGIGSAVVDALSSDPRCRVVATLSRHDDQGFDLLDEDTIERAAANAKAAHGEFDLIFDATGALEIKGIGPEKTIRTLDPLAMARQFAVNAIGPALLIKHFSPLLPKDRRSIFATLSAKVGSIGDNRLGGWISYRAAKAALNQIVRTSAIEIGRTHPHCLVVALHPGTVETRLSAKWHSSHPPVAPQVAAANLLKVVNGLGADRTGSFISWDGAQLPW